MVFFHLPKPLCHLLLLLVPLQNLCFVYISLVVLVFTLTTFALLTEHFGVSHLTLRQSFWVGVRITARVRCFIAEWSHAESWTLTLNVPSNQYLFYISILDIVISYMKIPIK